VARSSAHDQEDGLATQPDPQFEEPLVFLKDQRGFDFTGYKRASLMRRVARRMSLVGARSFDEYQDFLAVHPEEFTALFNTILINVTGFFRDRDAWAYLERDLLPDMLADRADVPVRAWSAGCASGEEAYSLAMVFAEVLGAEEFRERVKIYATDIDEEALALARQATYTDREIQGVPLQLREKYFEPVGRRFSFRKDLRRSVIFGRNDLVTDAPISHVDVLACRNTLMYFNAAVQSEILQRMNFALRPDGVLFLGRAEMLLSHSALFRPLEVKRRFFKKAVADLPDRRPTLLTTPPHEVAEQRELARLRDAAFMSAAAAQIVLDQDGELAFCNSRAGYLFGLTQRDLHRRIQDLEVSYRPIELRAHLDEATAERRPVWVRDVAWVRGPNDAISLDVQVVPLSDESGNALGTTVIFNDVTRYRQLQHELEFSNRQLETAYEELQSTNEELETTNEELQSTVEELETTNEELQSTNEELETMNEELQSMNDELHMSNTALRERQDEVDRLNEFMNSILGSLRTGVAVVDRDLRIRAWNATAEDLWGIRHEEAQGEHLFNLDIGLPLEGLRPVLRRQFGGDGTDPETPETLRLDAVNRRGRPVVVQVTVRRLTSDGAAQPPGAILVMDVVEGG
jgi:two-component system CheB/CheR fusion protein